MPNQTLLTFCAAAAFGLAVSSAEAAEIKVFVGGEMTETVEKMGADFARSRGNTLTYVSDTTGALLNRLKNGEKADVLVVTAPAMDGLEKDKGVVQGSRAELVRALIGVAVKAGAETPDISSPDAVKAALLLARSGSYVHPQARGTTGTEFRG